MPTMSNARTGGGHRPVERRGDFFTCGARGIGADHARRMLIQAFASDVVERIGIKPVRAQLEQMLVERF